MRVKLLLLLFGLYLFQCFSALGQAPVVKGGYCDTGGGAFDILPTYQGCGSLTVDLQNKVAGAQSVGYIMDYDISTSPDKAPTVNTHTYTKLGTYTILQLGSANGTGFSLCKQVKVLENRKVNATLKISCGTYALVTIADDEITQAYDYIEINWGPAWGTKVWKKGEALTVNQAYFDAIPNITVQGKYTASCSGDINILTPENADNSVEAIQIKRVEMQQDGRIALLYEGLDGVSTEIFYGDNGVFKTTDIIRSQKQPGNLTIDKNLNPENQYTVKLVSENCGGKKDSREVGTMVLKATALEGEIELEWNQYANKSEFAAYNLLRDDVVIKSFQSVDEVKWTDKDLDCNKEYVYQIVALTSLARSFSAAKTVKTTTSAPEKITKASVTVEAGNMVAADVVLEGKGLTGTYNLIVERAEQGSADFKQVSGVQNQVIHFEDKGVNTSGTSYCYRFSYENSCPLRSEFSDPVCTILLRQTPTSLTWNDANPFTEGLDSYDVIQTDANAGTAGLPVGLDTSYDLDLNNLVNADYSFQIRAHAKSGNLLSFSNLVRYDRKPVILIPDAFTPNGDTHNDLLEVKGVFVSSFKISVFNRWGQVVFQSDDMTDAWDGKIKGVDAPAGYYTYKTEIIDVYDQPFAKSGTVLLIR
ncbi:T9SS type B sorting domain-containing protein [Dyadobacter diqingensis]|uniref:T9SS type B sorting domain-containing protein n=1 Tax=Dyadobacter diqingensis TaxID=2938121 RepID=UPI0020C1A400|nr:gliding motility-associated C-terminal domain-containing protein [Dyadobacter diqingensis]